MVGVLTATEQPKTAGERIEGTIKLLVKLSDELNEVVEKISHKK